MLQLSYRAFQSCYSRYAVGDMEFQKDFDWKQLAGLRCELLAERRETTMRMVNLLVGRVPD